MIEVKTFLTKPLLTRFHLGQVRKHTVIAIAAFAVLFTCGVVLLIVGPGYLYGVSVLAASAVLPGLYYLAVRLTVRHAVESSPLLKEELTQTTRFGEKIWVNEYSKYAKAQDMVIEWRQVLRMQESDKLFCLFADRQNVFIIDKAGFTRGSAAELRHLAEVKLEKRFRSKARYKR